MATQAGHNVHDEAKGTAEPEDNWISLHMMDKGKYATYLSAASVVVMQCDQVDKFNQRVQRANCVVIPFLQGSMLSHPFYVLTTRQQVGVHATGDHKLPIVGVGTGLLPTFNKIGMRGMFHGALVSQIFNVPANVVYLWITEYTRESSRDFLFKNHPSVSVEVVDALQVTYSAFFANLFSMMACYPPNLVVSKMVIQNKENRTGFVQCCRQVYRDHGLRGFSLGFSSNFAYGLSVSMSWWYAYGHGRRICTELSPDIARDEIYVDAASGLIAGMFSTLLVHPLDTICARIMTGVSKDRTILGAGREIVKAEGIKMLWKGLLPSMMGTVVSSTIFALAYEFIKRASTAP